MTLDLTHARWSPRLSELLDGTLPAADAEACKAHIAACEPCQADLASLTLVVTTLQRHAESAPAAPSPAVWQGIAAQVAPRPARVLTWQRWTPWLAAAAIAVITIGVLRQPTVVPIRTAAAPVAAAPAPTLTAAAARTRPSYDASVADLRRLLDEDRAQLSPETRKAISKSLATIDSAIAEAERAVAADSTDVYVSSHLARIRARKLALLRQAARLVQS